MKKSLIWIGVGIIFLLAVLALRPVPVSRENSMPLEGTVDTAYLIDTKDLIIRISGDGRTFYINRASERDMDIPALVKEITGNRVMLHYARHWTPLDPFGRHKHVTEMRFGQKLLFTELD